MRIVNPSIPTHTSLYRSQVSLWVQCSQHTQSCLTGLSTNLTKSKTTLPQLPRIQVSLWGQYSHCQPDSLLEISSEDMSMRISPVWVKIEQQHPHSCLTGLQYKPYQSLFAGSTLLELVYRVKLTPIAD